MAKVKLTRKDILKIFQTDGKYGPIAREFKISIPMVHYIKSGRSWSKVTGSVNCDNRLLSSRKGTRTLHPAKDRKISIVE